jgi:hypothetical protein
MMSPLVQYSDLLREEGRLDSPRVIAFRKQHEDDPEFCKGARTIELVFEARRSHPAKHAAPARREPAAR